MTSKHLSENELQLIATKELNVSAERLAHLNDCSICQAKLNAYKTIFSNVSNLERPVFDFDLSDLVLEKIPAVKPKVPLVIYFAMALGVLFIAITFITFSGYLIQVFKALPTVYFLLIVVSALLLLCFQGYEAIKTYLDKVERIKVIKLCNNNLASRSNLI